MKLSKRRKGAQLPKNLKLILLENLELLGYPALERQGSLRVRQNGKLHFELINYPVAWFFKDWSCKISLQTWRTFNFSPKIVFFSDDLLLIHNQLYPPLAVTTKINSDQFHSTYHTWLYEECVCGYLFV